MVDFGDGAGGDGGEGRGVIHAGDGHGVGLGDRRCDAVADGHGEVIDVGFAVIKSFNNRAVFGVDVGASGGVDGQGSIGTGEGRDACGDGAALNTIGQNGSGINISAEQGAGEADIRGAARLVDFRDAAGGNGGESRCVVDVGHDDIKGLCREQAARVGGGEGDGDGADIGVSRGAAEGAGRRIEIQPSGGGRFQNSVSKGDVIHISEGVDREGEGEGHIFGGGLIGNGVGHGRGIISTDDGDGDGEAIGLRICEAVGGAVIGGEDVEGEDLGLTGLKSVDGGIDTGEAIDAGARVDHRGDVGGGFTDIGAGGGDRVGDGVELFIGGIGIAAGEGEERVISGGVVPGDSDIGVDEDGGVVDAEGRDAELFVIAPDLAEVLNAVVEQFTAVSGGAGVSEVGDLGGAEGAAADGVAAVFQGTGEAFGGDEDLAAVDVGRIKSEVASLERISDIFSGGDGGMEVEIGSGEGTCADGEGERGIGVVGRNEGEIPFLHSPAGDDSISGNKIAEEVKTALNGVGDAVDGEGVAKDHAEAGEGEGVAVEGVAAVHLCADAEAARSIDIVDRNGDGGGDR